MVGEAGEAVRRCFFSFENQVKGICLICCLVGLYFFKKKFHVKLFFVAGVSARIFEFWMSISCTRPRLGPSPWLRVWSLGLSQL